MQTWCQGCILTLYKPFAYKLNIYAYICDTVFFLVYWACLLWCPFIVISNWAIKHKITVIFLFYFFFKQFILNIFLLGFFSRTQDSQSKLTLGISTKGWHQLMQRCPCRTAPSAWFFSPTTHSATAEDSLSPAMWCDSCQDQELCSTGNNSFCAAAPRVIRTDAPVLPTPGPSGKTH